ncbi:hypothetical protein HMPREF1624_06591 [Sporothrix schenckii ATCC 58251]|uniref:Major facilitator superfamily (MFS) profile domain-containing protein n=1 Tax=Sporothrix schenckii (strain ATCC 58251 / de Perez 2211183) TaxID=1391915 RepID=U7PS05_SPOS1|nr:hypothetical protein HMPREF1624_06591 [Sporothrix schenckii ATCC 58251]
MAPSIAQLAWSVMRRLPFAHTTTPLQAATYLLGISLFSISFLVFLNSSISFVITDRIGVKEGVGNIVGTLGFVDELVALVACPVWGLVSDRLGVRLVAVIGYTVIALALVLSVQATNVYPQLLLARILFAMGATASTTMVTAILPSLTDDSDPATDNSTTGNAANASHSASAATARRSQRESALSFESQLTITPERFAESLLRSRLNSPDQGHRNSALSAASAMGGDGEDAVQNQNHGAEKPSKLAGFVGLFTGCGALVALSLFLPLPAEFGRKDGVTMAEAVADSFYVVAAVALLVAGFVFVGLRHVRGEDGKGWRMLLGRPNAPSPEAAARRDEIVRMEDVIAEGPGAGKAGPGASGDAVPYLRLLRDSVGLGCTDANIALGYLGGFVARASTVAISLFMPLFINAFFISNGFCQGSPNDPSPELKKECRAAYVLAAILTGVAQLMGLLCAPLFGYLSSRPGRLNVPLVVATTFGMVGYIAFPLLSSPEPNNVDGRGGTPAVFVVATLIGISQIGAIVCSLGSLGRGVLSTQPLASRPVLDGERQEQEQARSSYSDYAAPNHEDDAPEAAPLLVAGGNDSANDEGGDAADDSDRDTVRELVASPQSARRYGRARALSALTRPAGATTASSSSTPSPGTADAPSRIQLKGSIAGVYSWCGGAAILLLTKLGGYLFDHWSRGAPFYMMAVFNALLLLASLGIDAARTFQKRKR